MNLEIPDALYKRLKARAAIRGMRVKDFISVFLEEGLNQLSAPAPENGQEREQGTSEA